MGPVTSRMTEAESVGEFRQEFVGVTRALRAQAEGRKLAHQLTSVGVPVLVLKGPDLQARLYGTPAAYPSGDLDVLVPRRAASLVREVLVSSGWRFSPGNGILWRLSAAATYERDGFFLDLHWGIHAAHLPAASLRPLEQALWERAALGPSGMLEPDAESLLVFLAAHAVGHKFARPEWSENVRRCAALVEDWQEVWHLAGRARLVGAVRSGLRSDTTGGAQPVLDGVWGRMIWAGSWLVRGQFLPQRMRDRLRGCRSSR